MKKLIFILILSSIVCVKSYSQELNNNDSVINEKITKSKFYESVGFGFSTVDQKIIGPSTNLTSKLNVLNIGIGSIYRINEGLMIEGTVLALIGSSFNYYNFSKTSLTNLYSSNYTNSSLNLQRPINSAFSILSSSININARILRTKPSFLFFIPSYFFIGPKYDALIGSEGILKLKNYLGYQYGFKYKFSLKYVNIYPSITFSQTPNLYISQSTLVTNITNHYTNFTIYWEGKGGVKKFKRYVAPPNLKFSDIPLFKWRKK
jgi:hypothetical protein